MKTLHYLVGNPPSLGYGVFGEKSDFPVSNLLWLNNGKEIAERARVEVNGNIPADKCAHVWELQTGNYGVPVIIETRTITRGRNSGYSEYVMGEVNEDELLSEIPLGKIIDAADASRFDMLSVEAFENVGRNENASISTSGEWNMTFAETKGWEGEAPDPKWMQALLFHYWKQVSLRAFDESMTEPVHVFLKEYDEMDPYQDAEETIWNAKRFFGDKMDGILPPQVRNIASVAAGVNNHDNLNYLYTALQFDIAVGHSGEDFILGEKIPRKYSLNKAQQEFMDEVADGNKPAMLEKLLKAYRAASEQPEAKEYDTPFMADFFIWYDLYCLEHCIKEGHAFIEKACLNVESGRNGRDSRVGDARACYSLQLQLRNDLRRHKEIYRPKTAEERGRDLTEQLLLQAEAPLYDLMLASFEASGSRPFLFSAAEMQKYHQMMLYQIPEENYEKMIRLVCADQLAAEKPDYIRMAVKVPLRGSGDRRNAEFLSALMNKVFHPLIQKECLEHEKNDNPYIKFLGGDEFRNWCLSGEQSKADMIKFLREEAKEARAFFLTYQVSGRYREHITSSEMLCFALNHLTAEIKACQRDNPITVQQQNVTKDAIKKADFRDENTRLALTEFYSECMLHFGRDVSTMNNLIGEFGGDTTPALMKVFAEKQEAKEDLSPEEAKAYFESMAIPLNGAGCGDPSVKEAYSRYLITRANRKLEAWRKDPVVNPLPIDWLHGMLVASQPYFTVDYSNILFTIFRDAAQFETRMDAATAEKLFQKLATASARQNETVRAVYRDMLIEHEKRAMAKENPDYSVAEWLSQMNNAIASKQEGKQKLDTTEMLSLLFESHSKDMTPENARNAFLQLGNNAADLGGAVKNRFSSMLQNQLRNQDASKAFAWLSEMINSAPESYRQDENWLHDFQFIGLRLLHDQGEEIDHNGLDIIKGWLENGQMEERSVSLIQDYCNTRLIAEDEYPASVFLPYFNSISHSSEALEQYALGKVSEAMRQDLINGIDTAAPALLSSIVTKYGNQVQHYGLRADDLYDKVRENLDTYAQNLIEKSEAKELIAEKEHFPAGKFRALIQSLIQDKISNQQVELFNKQTSLQGLMELKENILQYNKDNLDLCIQNAYQFIDHYETVLKRKLALTDARIVVDTRHTIELLSPTLVKTGAVRDTLCKCLRHEYSEIFSELQSHGFRHSVASHLVRALLYAKQGDAPDWKTLRKDFLSNDRLEEAAKKPFSSSSVSTLQTLLSMLNIISQTENRYADKKWTEAFLQEIHTDPISKKYISALRRNKKNCERYSLSFDNTGKLQWKY